MYQLIKLSLLLLLMTFEQAQAQAQITVANGDTAGLMAAIDQANLSATPVKISLARNGRYDFSSAGLVRILGQVEIAGNGAELVNSSSTFLWLIVRKGGKLNLDSVHIHDMTRQVQQGNFFGDGALMRVDFEGELILSNSMINSISFTAVFNIFGPVFDNNGGTLILENVSVGDDITGEVAIIRTDGREASTSIRNSTLYFQKPRATMLLLSFGRLEVINSILGTPGAICPRDVSSLNISSSGKNIVSDDSCELEDQMNVPLERMGVHRLLRFDDSAPVFPLTENSPAIDQGANEYCTGIDGRGGDRPVDGDGDGEEVCDVGAFEYSGEEFELLRGRYNGLFYNQNTDGHFITLQEVRRDEVVVFWNTFDQLGAQAWVIGQGKIVENTILADAWTLEGGALVPGGAPEGANVTPWGQIIIEIISCEGGTFRYDSPLSNFGSGEFVLDRLGFADPIGCR